MTFFADHATCGCCGYHATERMLNELSLLQLERAARSYAGLERVLREESGDAPYVPGEVRLTELLAENADAVATDVEQPILDALDGPVLDQGKIIASMAVGGALWQAQSWPHDLDTNVREVLSATALIGQHDIPFGPALPDVDRLRIISGMSESAKYYTNRYFNEHVMPAVVDAVNAAVLNGLENDSREILAIRALLDRRLRSVPYWNLVANAAASRAYHFGYIKTGILHGFTTIRFQATIDQRTSQVCIDMNGTVWRAEDVSALADNIASAPGDSIKEVAPWVRPADVAGKSPDQLLAMGVAIPPLHGRCRSRLVFDS